MLTPTGPCSHLIETGKSNPDLFADERLALEVLSAAVATLKD